MNWACAVLLFICFKHAVAFDLEKDFERKGFSMNSEQLDQVYRRTAIVALLKAKASSELKNLPSTEKVIFDQCQGVARTPVELAKCVKRLLNERERHRAQVVIQSQLDEQPLMAEESWLSSVLKLTMLQNKNTTMPTMLTKPSFYSQPSFPPQHVPTLSQPRDPLRYRRVLKLKLNQKFRKAKKLKFEERTLFAKARMRRAIGSAPKTSPRCKTPTNIRSLRQVEKYFETANECIRYIKKLGLDNSNFVSSLFPLTYKNKKPGRDSAVEQFQSVVNQADSGFSFLSPKIMNLLPRKEGMNEKSSFLSPSLLSFHEEGLLPLPRLLKMAGSNECETQEWIDLIMTMTGASKKLDELLNRFQTHMKNLQDNVLPKIKELQRQEQLMAKINATMSDEQRRELQKMHYTKMNEIQLAMVYDKKGLLPPTKYFNKNKADPNQDYFLEQLVHQMAELEATANISHVVEQHKRIKRQTEPVTKVPGLLAPYAFQNQVFQPSFLGNLILSPHAFINELFNPRFLGSDIISPRAFVASTLSPFAMIARVLSPSAFRAQTLTPQALTAIVLVPEAFIAAILSPRALEARVLSPETLSVAVLSPSAGMVRVLSPASANVVVLSPTFLAAHAASKGQFNIEVLSPSILVADDGVG